ncbi:MAG: prepilin-type N-terminal cleavage/methylation domain-containing protein [bacterium]
MFKIIKNNNGLTLLELVIVVSLFSMMILATSRVFVKTIEIQERTMIEHNLQGNLRYAMGVLVYEAQQVNTLCDNSCTGCSGTDSNHFFYTSTGNELYFKNKDGDCVKYYLELDLNNISILKVDRPGATSELTSDEIDITGMKFETGINQDRFTIRLTAIKEDKKTYTVNYQISVTASGYED